MSSIPVVHFARPAAKDQPPPCSGHPVPRSDMRDGIDGMDGMDGIDGIDGMV